MTLTVIPADKDAAEIGALYRRFRLSLIDSMNNAHACGLRLIEKKAQLKQESGHGNWGRWLKHNAEVLGFEDASIARRLMRFARSNRALAHDMDEAAAITYSRQLWGHNDDDADDADDADDRDGVELDGLPRDADGKVTLDAEKIVKAITAPEAVADDELPVSTTTDFACEPAEQVPKRSKQQRQTERFNNNIRIVFHTCEIAVDMPIPCISEAQADTAIKELSAAKTLLGKLTKRIRDEARLIRK